jgi:glycosyltransferase involved in cell wall biosynthesis
MRVLHFYKTYKPDSVGGVEELIGQICSGAAKRGVRSDVLTVSRNTETVDLGDHLHHRAKLNIEIASSAFSISAFRQFEILARDADVIHYHFPWPFMDLVHFATRVRKPTVVTYHSDIVRQQALLKVYRPLRDRFLSSVSRIVATSPNYVETSEVLRKYRDKIDVIPIGLDEAAYPEVTKERLDYWRGRVGEKFFLFVGNLRYYKGLHILLQALQGSDLPVVIIGAGPMEKELKKMASDLRLTKVNFVGAVDDQDKVALLTMCRALTFPSHLRSEAFGISLLEGAMFRKPLISTEIGTGTSFINVAGQTGLVMPPSDPIAFRRAMDTLWDDSALCDQMGRQGRLRFEQLFTADKMVDGYLDVYQRLSRG